jgi:DNA polymerase-1
MNRFYFDLETFLIAPGCAAPPIVCLSYATDTSEPRLVHVSEARDLIARFVLDPNYTVVGHNTSFDLACICAQWPDLVPLIFQAYAEDRVTDTLVRQKLIDIGRGRAPDDKKLRYDLASVSERCDGPILNKEDPWRLRYGQLYQVPVGQWPAEALDYALNDAQATRAVFQAQESQADYLVDQFRQARAAWVLRLMECWGLAVDRGQAERYIVQVQKTLAEDRRIAAEAGLVRPDGTKNTKAAQAWMERICEETGEKCPRTETGLPQLSEEAVEEHGDFVLEAYQRYANANTRTKRAQRLLIAAEKNLPIQASFNVLVNTGRTSCSQGDGKKGKIDPAPSAFGAQVQNPSKDKGYREVFVARPGYALVSIDYDALELHTWSQVCIWLFGYSRMAEVINEGRDAHTELAAELVRIPVEEAYRRKKEDESFNNGPRFFSKAGNFGFLGGMGGAKFCKSLVKQAVHQGDPTTIATAKAYTEAEAKQLKAAFLRKWTEGDDYFKYINRLLGGKEKCTVKHFKSERLRGQCWYTQACNSFFQGLAADLAKDAMFRISREMYCDRNSPLYGSRLVNFVHDEGILEVPTDGRLHDASYRARDIMCQTGADWCPDLVFTAEPAAMTAWSKNAKTKKDACGKLMVHDTRLAA